MHGVFFFFSKYVFYVYDIRLAVDVPMKTEDPQQASGKSVL